MPPHETADQGHRRPATSRRDFLTQAAVAGSLLAVASPAWAAPGKSVV